VGEQYAGRRRTPQQIAADAIKSAKVAAAKHAEGESVSSAVRNAVEGKLREAEGRR
jgi:hypothetical protein